MAFINSKFNRICLIVRILLVVIVLIAAILSATCDKAKGSTNLLRDDCSNRYLGIDMWLHKIWTHFHSVRARCALFFFELLLLLFACLQIVFLMLSPRKRTIERALLIIELVLAVGLFITEAWYASGFGAVFNLITTWAGAAAMLLISAILICVDILLSFKYALE